MEQFFWGTLFGAVFGFIAALSAFEKPLNELNEISDYCDELQEIVEMDDEMLGRENRVLENKAVQA